jgi:hypothetical protein
MSQVEVDKVIPQSGTTLTIGDSGDTINLVGTLQSNGSPLPGDISSVVAGTGLSGGGTTGAVTINIESAQPTITSLGTLSSATISGDVTVDTSTLKVDSSNDRVGIGTASPSSLLHIFSSEPTLIIQDGGSHGVNATPSLSLRDSSGAMGTINYSSAGLMRINQVKNSDLTFQTNNTERMRIDSSGRVGIGNSSMSSFDSEANNLVVGSGSGDEGITIYTGSSAGHHGSIFFADGTSGDALRRGKIRYEHNNEIMSFFTNTSERMRINSSGNVGIGTTNPSRPLHVVGADGNLVLFSNNVDADLNFTTSSGVMLLSPSTNKLAFGISSTEKIRLTSTGLGIGTTSPSNLLDVKASSNNEDVIRISHPSSPTAAGAVLGFNSDGTTDNNVVTLGIHYSGNFYDVINLKRSTQFVGIGTTNPQEQLDISSNGPRIRFSDTSITNLRHLIGSEANDLEISCDVGNVDSNSHIRFKVDGSEKVRISAAGNVGIGITNPSTPLHILTTDGGNVDESLIINNNSTTAGTGSRIRLVNSTDAASTANSVSISSVRNAGSDHDLLFESSNNERMRITSAGNVGIGTSSPASELEIESATPEIRIDATSGAGRNYKVHSDGNELYIEGIGSSGSLKIGEDGTYGVSIDLGTGGIQVSDGIYLGGTGTANKLSDYEEGTWTPVLTTSGNTDYSSVGYSIQYGHYTKVGRMVTTQCRVQTNSFTQGSPSGNVQISGLPFTSATNNIFDYAGCVGFTARVNYNISSFGTLSTGAVVNRGTTLITLTRTRNDNVPDGVPATAITGSGFDITITVSYIV